MVTAATAKMLSSGMNVFPLSEKLWLRRESHSLIQVKFLSDDAQRVQV
jgi:hypothetical protein